MRPVDPPTALRRLAVVGRWLAVLAVAYLGGVAATNLFPTTVESDNYSAVIRLDAIPARTPVLHAPTIVGDVDLEFASPLLAPGVDVSVAVREEITTLFTSKDVSIRSLQPTDAELSDAARAAAIGVGLRFALGTLLVGAGLSAALYYARRRPPQAAHVALVTSAVVAAVGGTAFSVAATYQPDRFTEYRTTGLLGTVQRNAGMLAGVEARAEQVSPYLRNLLAVSQALQEKYVPDELAGPVAARFLLVSDIHGANQYPLMQTIIEEEGIDAVIDTGDLLNFGRVEEAEAAGIFRGIESLGVPYLFVSGNHDAASATDRSVLRRLSQVPNVVLLQDETGQHRRLSFHGLRITGFNDPRYFGDDARDLQDKQAPAAEAYNAAMEGEPESDLVLTHEPYAADLVEGGRLLVNGHIHSADLSEGRLQVGTFTGGGVVARYIEGEGEELRGQPYAFDIATYGSSCQLTQLVRYSYRNLLEGRPAYDTVQVVNGSRVVPPPEEVDSDGSPRSCSRIEPTSLVPLGLVPPGSVAPEPLSGTGVPTETTEPPSLPPTTATPGPATPEATTP